MAPCHTTLHAAWLHMVGHNALTNLLLGTTVIGVAHSYLSLRRARRLEVTAARLYAQGLADTVIDLRDDPINGNGLIIRAIASISLSRAVADAVKGYQHPQALALARRSAMSKDSSWDISLDVYEALFRRLLRTESPEKR